MVPQDVDLSIAVFCTSPDAGWGISVPARVVNKGVGTRRGEQLTTSADQRLDEGVCSPVHTAGLGNGSWASTFP